MSDSPEITANGPIETDGTTIRHALVLGSSGGIGAAMVRTLEQRGVHVTGLSRRDDGLDVTDEASIRQAFGRLQGRRFDLVLNATGGLILNGVSPEKTISAIDPQNMAAHFALNATAVALLIKHSTALMAPGRAVFASLSARLASVGDNRLGGWISYRAAKTAQNQIIHTAAIELARTRPGAIVVALHPGTVATSLTAPFRAAAQTDTTATAAARLLRVIEALGPGDSGGFIDQHGKTIPW
ncbi:SDR family NAD(P)-dependent oxidoreductase [Pseudorhodobacter turbinis]|uniref:SDR family NAD(P)-dependent oxidoreductase n=1 Tax=Pseudorhodobacter turbinis TaxID=2500533 RepID=A0A4P8EGX4_9RHOB|nr:SDR family NAD(P)-dependent oxidoreductase [Pseudorhodobacter turbinis]QCO56069.1 SDR family NAD(P)-dependent oxidoreductase [Pseudorhodobacter turbinis]